jgi:hypothetical protein
VLRVHFSFGSARHIGHLTDSMCRKVSSDFTPLLFDAADLKDGQCCSLELLFRVPLPRMRIPNQIIF